MKCECEWRRRLIYRLQILSGVDEASCHHFFPFCQGANRKVPGVCSDPLLVTTLLLQLFHSCYSLIIFSLFPFESLTPFPILLNHSVFAVCCNGPLGKFWRPHTKDNKNNWSKSQQTKLNRQRWMFSCEWVCVCARVCVLYKVHIDLKQICQWRAV